jgi:uncharacterized protein
VVLLECDGKVELATLSKDGVSIPLDLLTPDQAEALLRSARRIAVLGIKPESRRELAAYWIPEYLASVGYQIVPVPVRYPDETEILGRPVVRTLGDIEGPVDILSIFRKPEDLPTHLDEILDLRPGAVWIQSGLLNENVARAIVGAGIPVVVSCIACARAEIEPAARPLEGCRDG